MSESNHDPPFFPSSASTSSASSLASTSQQQLQPQYYYSPTATFSPTFSPGTASPDPLLVTAVRKYNILCVSLRYSTTMPTELAPYLPAAEYAASIKRFNSAMSCRSWVLTFVLLAVCFLISGAIMIGIGAQQDDGSDDDSDNANTNSSVMDSGGGSGGNATGAGIPASVGGGNQVLLKVGIAFTVFAFSCLVFTSRRWRVGRAKELTNTLLIENTRYAQRRPLVRFQLTADGWVAKGTQRNAPPVHRWVLQVEVCGDGWGGDTSGSWSGSGQQAGPSFALVNLTHSNVMRLRERNFSLPLQRLNAPTVVDMPSVTPMTGVSMRLDDQVDEEEVSVNSQQPPPAYSDIEMQPVQHIQQEPQQRLPTLPQTPVRPTAAPDQPTGNAATPSYDSSSTTQPVDWQPVKKEMSGSGAVVMLSSQAAVVDESKVKEYEDQLRRLVVERAQQDEKMQEMQRELENMRAQQQPPLVITLTDFSSSSDGVMRSLPPGSDRQPQQSDGRLAVHTKEQAEGETPSSNAAAGSGSRSGVVLLGGRRYSF